MGTLRPFVDARNKAGIRSPEKGVKNRTINYSLQIVCRILHLAAYDWRDLSGMTWLSTAPKIRLLPESDRRKPYPMSWDEQGRLFRELPPHLQRMRRFKVKHRLSRSGSVRSALGLGSHGAGTQNQRFSDTR